MWWNICWYWTLLGCSILSDWMCIIRKERRKSPLLLSPRNYIIETSSTIIPYISFKTSFKPIKLLLLVAFVLNSIRLINFLPKHSCQNLVLIWAGFFVHSIPFVGPEFSNHIIIPDFILGCTVLSLPDMQCRLYWHFQRFPSFFCLSFRAEVWHSGEARPRLFWPSKLPEDQLTLPFSTSSPIYAAWCRSL